MKRSKSPRHSIELPLDIEMQLNFDDELPFSPENKDNNYNNKNTENPTDCCSMLIASLWSLKNKVSDCLSHCNCNYRKPQESKKNNYTV